MFPLVYMPHLQYVPPEVILSSIIISCSLFYNLPAEMVKLLDVQEVLSIPENLSLYKNGQEFLGIQYVTRNAMKKTFLQILSFI